MDEVDRLISLLQGPVAPISPPDVRGIERRRRWRWAIGATVPLLAAAAALLWLGGPGTGQTQRGTGDPPQVELRLVMSDGHQARRLHRETGERAYFRVAASEPAEVSLWVEGPRGRERIARVQADVEPQELRQGAGYLVYEFDTPGHYVFSASVGERCAPPSCDQVVLEIR
jgi:hypothetical protein